MVFFLLRNGNCYVLRFIIKLIFDRVLAFDRAGISFKDGSALVKGLRPISGEEMGKLKSKNQH